jgi:[ribosomal protein S5]-alanine N-acetyltransferase
MASHPGWPATLAAGPVALRPPRLRDGRAWSEIRLRNQRWLEPWEPTSPVPWRERNASGAWPQLNGALKRAARNATMLPFMLVYGGRLAGQMTVSNVVHGVQRSCTVGYWVDGALAGRGLAPTALAVVIDHCFTAVHLHRVEIDIRPENTASLRVVEKLGLRREGYFERYLDIDGAWRDHLGFAVTVEELGGATMLSRLPMLPPPPSGRSDRS